MVPFITEAKAFNFFSWAVALGWLWQAVASLRGMPRLADLTSAEAANLPPLPTSQRPHLTVIVPACNEEATIQTTLRSLLASTGICLQIIAIDDRSTDSTGEKMDEVAAEAAASGGPHQLEIVHISTLPQGWLGKPHAMAMGAQQAIAPWLLFTDGDVEFQPQALELALRKALSTQADHFVLVPSLIYHSTGERAMLAAMQSLAQWTVRLWKVSTPRARDFIGVGGFNLLRRDVYTRIGGFESLRMEVLDDLRLGWRIKRAGYAQRVAVGPGLVRIRWIPGALSVVQLMEKNGFAIYRYRVWLHLLACLAISLQVFWPLVAIAAGGWPMLAGLLTYAAIGLVYAAGRRVTQVAPWHVVFFAPAGALVVFAFLRSMILALLRRGVDWRGTRYPLKELRSHAGSGW